jgi:UDP-3-O-[3-hydroxymyristoyl] glucosamine N-acyltransferase
MQKTLSIMKFDVLQYSGANVTARFSKNNLSYLKEAKMFVLTTGEIANLTDGKLRGAEDVRISGIRPLESAGRNDLAFLADKSLYQQASQCQAGALLTKTWLEGFEGVQILCDDPELALSRVLDVIHKRMFSHPEGVSQSAAISPEATLGSDVAVGQFSVIEPGARLGDNVIVYPLVYIGRNVTIGNNTVIYPHATIFAGVEIGESCIIHPNTVLGDDGFGFIQRKGRHVKYEHVGKTKISDDVEIGALSSIDRGMIADTCVEEGTKIDEHCMIAHNCSIGKHCILAGYARMAGSVRVKDNAILAADVRIADHKTIGEKAVLGAGTGVAKDIEDGARVWGTPARPFRQQMKIKALQGRLPEMHQRLKKLEDTVESLKKLLEEEK